MTSSITPNPAIHTMPALDSGEFTALDWQQLIAWGQTLLTEIEQAVAFALLNVSVLGVKPFAALQQFGSEVLGAATDLQTLIEDVGSGDITGVVSAINNLTNDISSLISGIGGTAISDVVTAIDTSINNFIALISGIGGSNVADVVNLLLKIQQLIDGIANALGHLGAGFSITDIVGFLQNIPTSALDLTDALAVDSSDVITAITGTTWFTDLQSALGLTGAGLGTGGLSFPSLSGIPLLGDLLSITDTGVVDALTGTTWFGDLQSLLGNPAGLGTGSFSLPGIGSIPLLDGVAAIDTLMQAWGSIGTGYSPSDLYITAQNISNTFVTGVLTSPDIGTAVQQQLNAGAMAIGAVTSGIDATLAQWQSQLSNVIGAFLGYNNTGAAPPTTSVAAVATAAHNTITSRAVQNNLFEAQDPTANSVFPMSDIEGLTTQATIDVTEGSTLAGYITTRDGGFKEAIGWLGHGGSSLTSAVFNIYSVDTSTGIWTWVYQTPDFHAALGGSVPAWNFYNLSVANYLNTSPGQMWVAEMRVTGTATHHVVGKQANLPTYPSTSIFPSAKGVHRSDFYYYTSPHPLPASVGAGAAVQAKTASYTHTITTGTNNWYLGVYQSNTSGSLNTANITVTLGARTATLVGGYTFATGNVLLLYEVLGSGGTPLPTGAQTVTYTETGTLGTVNITLNSVEVNGVASRSIAWTSNGTGTTANSVAFTADPSATMLVLFGATAQAFTPDAAMYTAFNQAPSAPAKSTLMALGSGGTLVSWDANLAASDTWGTIEIILVPAVNHPTTVANPTPTNPASYSTDTPFFLLTGNPGATQLVYNPILKPFGAGTSSFTPPSWANYCDVIPFGAGGGGGGGSSLSGGGGTFGARGVNGAVNLAKSNWTAGSPWTISVGAGGAGGGPNLPGSAGGGTSVTVPGYGSITVGGGGGGAAGASGGHNGLTGQTEPDVNFADAYGNNNTYGGGGGGPGGLWNSYGGQNGAQPGGGGGGGGAAPTNFSSGPMDGGNGGDGEVYLLFYQ